MRGSLRFRLVQAIPISSHENLREIPPSWSIICTILLVLIGFTQISIDYEVEGQRTETAADRPERRRRFRWWRRPTNPRAESKSAVYGRILPAVIIILTLLMVALILFALGVLLGVIPFR